MPSRALRPDSFDAAVVLPSLPGALNATALRPAWPGRPYRLACPHDTPAALCNSLSSRKGALEGGCSEPEVDTVEVLNSFLLGREGALYVDIGCNLGYHAAHAAALGALVECYEPTPMYVKSILESRRLNDAAGRWTVHHAAVVPQGTRTRGKVRFHTAYQPCGIGAGVIHKRGRTHWEGTLGGHWEDALRAHNERTH